ncbi:MAG: ABC transporter ATP-binding protein [Chlorobiota bacterium]|nr:ABC transporter ATP-binding protein [Chlorobiota bacterium]QQS65504.1 MAG: ABC transporter ATP-binding protein [Chlorobiota bacterium]
MKQLLLLKPYFLKYKYRLLLGLFTMTISNVFSSSIPKFIGNAIDIIKKAFDTNITGNHIDILTQQEVTDSLLKIVYIIVLLAIGSGIFSFFTRQCIIVVSRFVEYDLRKDFNDHIATLPMDYFTKTPTGDIMALATNDIPQLREIAGPAIMYTVNTFTTILFSLFLMLNLSVKVTAFALIPLPIVSYLVYRFGKKIHELSRKTKEQFANITSFAQEDISGVRVIRAYNREKHSSKVFNKMSLEYKNRNLDLVKVDAAMQPIMISLIGVSQVMVLLIGGYEAINKNITLGQLAQFFSYINQLIWPVISIGWISNMFQRAIASIIRIKTILDTKSEDSSEKEVVDFSSDKVSIEFKNVSFKYLENLPLVLKNVSFKVESGDTLAIIGSTGSGKSSITNLIGKLYETTNGDILLNGISIKDISYKQVRELIGTVTQETFLFSDTVEGNIRFGSNTSTLNDVKNAAEIAQLNVDIRSFPNGFDTIVGERGITLSGGQKQRTSIARAILRNPKIIILDDALSAVDTQTEENILTRLKTIMKDKTTILISHRISTVKDADNIIVLDSGEIIETGTHNELLSLKGKYNEIYELQILEDELSNM